MVFFNKNAEHMLQATPLIALFLQHVAIHYLENYDFSYPKSSNAYTKFVDSSDYLNLKH